jgi:hypothetical protein
MTLLFCSDGRITQGKIASPASTTSRDEAGSALAEALRRY